MIAARAAAIFARDPLLHREFEGDVQLVLAAPEQEAADDPSSLGARCEKCLLFYVFDPHTKLSYSSRESNNVSHRLAKLGLTLEHQQIWFEEPLM